MPIFSYYFLVSIRSFVFLYIIIGSLNIDNHSKTLVFKKLKCLLYKYYPKLVKTFQKHSDNFDVRQFLVLLHDCVPNMKNYYSIDTHLKNVNVLQVETVKNPTTPLYSDTKENENFLNKKI